MALALRSSAEQSRVYAVLGDGELQEGQVWEAAMSAAHYRTANLCAIVDANRLQIDGRVEEIMNVAPIASKFEAFGWKALEIDGHDIRAITSALESARQITDRPTVVVAHTIKGKGVSRFEDKVQWHGKAPNDSDLAYALHELGEPEEAS